MAKDLPYFKFFCSEWADGDISLEPYELQGLFISICAFYWSRECDIEYITLCKKFKGNVDGVNDLIEAGIIKELDGNISINFLDEQIEERVQKSKINSINGRKGGRPKKRTETEKKPNALNSLTETKGNKRREEKKREEKNIPTLEEFGKYMISKKSNLCKESITLKYQSWVENGWKDGNDKPIKNWKSKALNVIPYLKEVANDNLTPDGRIKSREIDYDKY